jgi:hypothetical protein
MLVALLGALIVSSLAALDIREGRVRVVIDDRSGRMALYYLDDPARSRYTALLYDQESSTTYPTLMIDQRTYKLGESPEFRTNVSRQPTGALVEYRSSFCVVKFTLKPIAASGSGAADSLAITVQIENISERDYSTGLRYLFDTWLGERSSKHLSIPTLGSVSGEMALSGVYADDWLESPGDAVSLVVLLDRPATKPDKILFGNWKRINDTPWSFDVNPSRAFTLLPYSINDSAIALFYEPQPLRRGATRKIDLFLGTNTVKSMLPAKSTDAGWFSIDSSTRPGESTAIPLAVMTDLILARKLLKDLNDLLAAGLDPSPADLAAFEETLRRLEDRKSNY